MSIIQFSHANGFPSKTYTKLFDNLREYKISAINNLGENTKVSHINWYSLSDEILESVDKIGEPVIGIGHSLGGVLTLLAAAKKPELFHSVILLDPPLFSLQKRFLINIFRYLNIEDWVTPAGKSKYRRDHFQSKLQAKSFFQANKLFKKFHPDVLNDYVTHGLINGINDVELTISVEKELAIFRKIPTSLPKGVFKVKCILVHAAKNPIIWKSDLRWINKNFIDLKVIPFPGSHLFPLENPESTALMIKRCL